MKKRTARRAFLVPGVIIVGILIMVALIMGRRPPEQIDQVPLGALVDVIVAEQSDRPVTITGHGNVAALEQINLIPQVSGQVVWVHPDFLAGGSFRKGEEMVRIEPADYELGVQQAEAMVAQARYQLEVTEANAEIARTEWELIEGNSTNGEPSPLVMYEPQLRQAKANLQSAEAGLAQAELSLDRTVLRAPFNCKISSESVSLGQQVNPQGAVAQLYGTDVAEIEVTLQPADLAYIQIPGAKVDVLLESGDKHYTFEGYVHREVGVISNAGRLARVVVRIDDPYRDSNGSSPVLSLGSFVEAHIQGELARDVFAVPRSALREDDQVWVARDNLLSIRPVDIYFKTADEVYLTSGLADGELVVLTSLAGAANGMKLRPVLMEEAQ